MQANSQPQKGRGGVLSTLNATIETLNLAKEICSVTPAKAAFGSVSALLAMIRVSLFLLSDHGLPIHVSLGVDDQRTRLRRPRIILCRCMQRSRQGVEGEAIGRAQSFSARGSSAINYVSWGAPMHTLSNRQTNLPPQNCGRD